MRQNWVGVENRQGILVGNGGPYSLTCEIISTVSDAPGIPHTMLGYAHFKNTQVRIINKA